MRKLLVIFMVLICTVLVACEAREDDYNIQNNTIDETEEHMAGDSRNNPETSNGNNTEHNTQAHSSEDLVSVSEFMDYYEMQDTDIPIDYIEAFIQDKHLTVDMLGELNYDQMLIKMHERGVTFGTKIVDLIQGEMISISDKDDFSDVEYIVVSKELYPNGNDISEEQNIILEVKNLKVYITSMSVTDDYTTEENVRDVTEENMREYLQQLRSIITDEWEQYHQVENKEYTWKLYIVKEDSSLIYYEGESVDETNHPGFEDWCENVRI